jgi:hypothetical protein
MRRLARHGSPVLLALACSCAATSLGPSPDGGTPIDRGADAPLIVKDGPIGTGQLVFDPCATNPLAGYDPAGAGLASCCTTGPAHCVPSTEIIPRLVNYLAPCDQGATCMPDPIIRAGGQYRPPSCTSSVFNAPGACLSTCIPLVANNPQTVLLRQDSCGTGELCIPCVNPLDHTQTGACNLLEQLCPTGDAGVAADAGVACPYTGPPVIDPSTLPACSPTCGGAHCLPATLVPPAQQPLLKSCAAAGGAPGLCAPDKLIATGGNFVPKTCTSVAGSEGRCLSTCLPDIAEKAAFLRQDVCAPDERCAPCFDPTSSDPTAPTGACSLACDKPAKPPVVLTCPWTGPPVIDPKILPACAPACGGAHCVPGEVVPAALQPLLAVCPGGFCAPDPLIETAGETLLKSCTSIAGAEGRCLSTCLPEIAGKAGLLPKDSCATGEVCAPCFDPTADDPKAPTGACTIGCDQPKQPPLILSCPWTGPPIIDAGMFPACSPACGGSHCLPASLVPSTLQALLAPCTDGFCAPDTFIESAGKFVPKKCTSVAGAEGRCLSMCLPEVSSKSTLLPTDVCATDERCVPCYDPTSDNPTAPTGACSIGCDMATAPPVLLTCPWKGPPVIDPTIFPACSPACDGSHCVPKDLVPEAERALLARCTGGYCVPDPITASDNNWVPPSCTSIAGAEGRCLTDCLPEVASQPLLPQSTCAAGSKCVPCYDPTSGEPTVATGACSLGCDEPSKPPVILSCPWTGPAVIDPGSFPQCSPACNGAHCLPADLVPQAEQALLAPCTGGFCTPDGIIRTDNNWVPATCTSIAGAEGRCLSTCLPEVASQPLLPQGTCGPDEKCVPCFDPTNNDADTQACRIACDKPAAQPVQLTCPWHGPAVIDPAKLPDCAPACGGAHCLPAQYVPEDQQKLLAACPGGFCAPDDIIKTDNNWVPATCTSIAGAEGRCLSTCLPEVSSQPLLPQSTCATNERCVPCFDPTNGDADTHACEIACDKPVAPPVVLTCGWSGPPVIDPSLLPACSPACGGAHCLPAAYVPGDAAKLLATCPGGYCTPDPIIRTDDNWIPATCTSIAGAEGRCLSTCLPEVSSQPLLPQSTCQTGEKCVPCYDPTNGDAPTGACTINPTCDQPAKPPVVLTCPWNGPAVIDPSLLPTCCAGSHCLPAQYVPDSAKGLLASCQRGTGYCTPDPIIRTDDNWVPASCRSVAGVEGRCLSTCLPAISTQPLLPQSTCASNERCAPCYDPTSSDWTAPTGACSIASCDHPHEPPTQITCPWTGPPVIDPNLLPGCCTGAHCLPTQYVPPADRNGLLAGCPGGFCTPDPIIRAGGEYRPPGCEAFAGTGAEGRCLSNCLPLISSNGSLEDPFPCATSERCAPCTDPCTGSSTGACSTVSCDTPQFPAFTFPNCCFYNGGPQGKCIPKSQIPSGSQGNLEQNNCTSAELCIPYENLPAGSSCRPPGWWTNSPGCTVQLCTIFGCVTLYHGTCYSNCLDLGIGSLFPSCIDGNHSCVP